MSAFFQKFDELFDELIDTTQPPELLASGFIWTEGPVWMNDTLYFNDIPSKKMMKWQEQIGVNVALENNEFANGNTIDKSGRMVSCEHGGRRVLCRIDPENEQAIEILADKYRGKRLNSPNDVIVRSDGSVWFTDPPYGINSEVEGYPANSEMDGCYVFCVLNDGSIHVVARDFDKPNGLAFSPDEKKLYIADSGAIRGASFPEIDYSLPHHIRVFDVEGITLSNSRIFSVITPGVPDGLRVDLAGQVWTSALDGVHCLDSNGQCLGKIRLPKQTSNLCFGGSNGTDMFITSSDSVWRVRTKVKDAANQ